MIKRKPHKKHRRNKYLNLEVGTPEYRKSAYIKYAYGITYDEYIEMHNKQNGKCAICKMDEKELNTKLSIDHCHSTGKVRGLLCHNCNHALGKFKENIEIVSSALMYLKQNLEV